MGPWSDEWSFTTPQASPASIRPSDPPPGVTVSSLTPSLIWTDDNAFIFYYEIQLSKDELFDTNPRTAIASVFFNLVHGGESRPFNSWAVPAAYPLEQCTRYFWRVRPRVQGNGAPPNWPPSFWFTTPGRGPCLITPTPTVTSTPTSTPTPTATATSTPTGTPGGIDPNQRVGPFVLTLTIANDQGTTGGGSVTGFPLGIDCPPDCSEMYAKGTSVTLIAHPLGGWYFRSWSGAGCSSGVVTMDDDRACTAIFTRDPRCSGLCTLSVMLAGSGTGSVTSSPPGINCGIDCAEPYAVNTIVSLTAIPGSGSRFSGWTGDPDCTDGQVTMNSSKTCTALFELVATATPTFTPNPSPTASQTPTPTATSTPTATPTATPTNALFAIMNGGSTGSLICHSDTYPCGNPPTLQTPEFANKVCSDRTGDFQVCRAFLSFDTSSIPNSATILSATLEFSHSGGNFLSQDGTTLVIVSASQGVALTADDWDRVGSASFASVPVSALQASGLNTMALNSGGISSITKGGLTHLGLRLGLDMQGQRPSGQNQINIDMTAAGSMGVKLKVTYRP